MGGLQLHINEFPNVNGCTVEVSERVGDSGYSKGRQANIHSS